MRVYNVLINFRVRAPPGNRRMHAGYVCLSEWRSKLLHNTYNQEQAIYTQDPECCDSEIVSPWPEDRQLSPQLATRPAPASPLLRLRRASPLPPTVTLQRLRMPPATSANDICTSAREILHHLGSTGASNGTVTFNVHPLSSSNCGPVARALARRPPTWRLRLRVLDLLLKSEYRVWRCPV